MKWLGLALGLLLAGFVLFPGSASSSSALPLGEATFVVG